MSQQKILVCGPQGSGRTFLIENVMKELDSFVRISASTLLCGVEAPSVEDYAWIDASNQENALENFNQLVGGFDGFCFLNAHKNVFIDVHLRIKSGLTDFVELPAAQIQRLGATKLVYLDVPAEIIQERRLLDASQKDRGSTVLEDIEAERAAYKAHFLSVADACGVPFIVLDEWGKQQHLLSFVAL